MKSTFCAILLLLVTPLMAENRLAHIFQDHMVLQREMPVPVWGWADPGAAVQVSFAGQTKQATADDKGYWKAVLEPLAASREGRSLEVRVGQATLTCKDVLVGEVWVAAGQSNMVAGGPDQDTGVYPHHVSPAGKPEIRIAGFGWGASLEPMADIDPAGRKEDTWAVMKDTASMGPANYFARVLRDGLDVPVGIVRVAVPGTNQAAWMSRPTLESFPGTGSANFYEEFLATHEKKLADAGGPIKSFADMKRAEDEWRKAPKGRTPASALTYANFPTALYNTRIHPLAPFAFRGAIWHQGEAGPGGPYGERLAAMARQWRTLFGHDFYFVWGTLGRSTTTPPPLTPVRAGFYRSNNNHGIRSALAVFGEDRKVSLVELYDLGNEETHFLQKHEMGRRYALAALTLAYGQQHLYTGPRMVETTIDAARATVRFDHAGDGLVYQPSIDGISGFYLRDKAGQARWANVKVVDKTTLELSHPDLADLQTVAYGEHPNPHETLFNSARLPASPFVVNPTNTRDPAPTHQLLAIEGKTGAQLQLAHVRRGGYVFQLKPTDAKAKPPGPVTLQAYIPTEWQGYEVESAGRPLTVRATDKDGHRFVTFEAPVDQAWIIISEKGKTAEFRKVNRY